MKNTNKKQGVAVVHEHDHPGRPRYGMKFPRSAEWTFTQLMAVNGVETDKGSKNFGKGDKCTMLTLRKNLKHDMYRADGESVNSYSLVVEVKGVTAEPDSDSGLGRRATLYRLRAVVAKDHSVAKATPKAPIEAKAVSVAKAPRKARKAKVTAKAMINEAKAILAEPTTVLTIAPAPEVVPVAEIPAPAPAPEVEVAIANEAPAAPEVAPVQAPAETIAA